MILKPEGNDDLTIEADPFRRLDVDYTTVSWTNPQTGEDRAWSLPIEFIATFFGPVELDEDGRVYVSERLKYLRSRD